MAASVRSVVLMGNGQTTSTATLTLAIPSGAAIGDIVAVSLYAANIATTLTTPSGWTLDSGPNAFSSSASWALHKKLVSGDPGSNVNFTISAARHYNGIATIIQDGTDTGLVYAEVNDSGGGATTTTPSVTGSAGGMYVVHFSWARATSTPAPDITVASPLSQVASPRSATNFGVAPEYSNESAYEAATGGGTIGGDTMSTVNAGVGMNYAWFIPTGSVTQNGGLTGSGTLSQTNTPLMTKSAGPSGSGTLSQSNTPIATRSAGPSGSGTLTATYAPALGATGSGSGALSAAPTPLLTKAAALSGSGTLTATDGNTLNTNVSGDGLLAIAGIPRMTRALSVAGSGTLSATSVPLMSATRAVSGSGAVTANYIFFLSLIGDGTLEAYFGDALIKPFFEGSGQLSASVVPFMSQSAVLSGSGQFVAAKVLVAILGSPRALTVIGSARGLTVRGRIVG